MAVLVGLAWAEDAWTLAALVVLAGMAFGATFVPGMALLTRAADAAGLGSVLAIALANFAWALGNAVGAPASGWLGDRLGEAATYLLLAAVCGLALAVVHAGTRRASATR
jgi:predicted MFS family arabinose efflux permease